MINVSTATKTVSNILGITPGEAVTMTLNTRVTLHNETISLRADGEWLSSHYEHGVSGVPTKSTRPKLSELGLEHDSEKITQDSFLRRLREVGE